MSKNRSARIKNLLAFLISVVALSIGFYQNEWGAAGKKWFYDWKSLQEFMLIGRLAETRQHGILSHSGLIGLGDGDSWLDIGQGLVKHQSDVYLNNGTFEKYSAYDTEPAAYSIVFGLIDELTNFSPAFNIKLFHALSALLSATALSLFIVWVGIEFNLFAAGLTLLFCMFSEWFTLFGGSMYWNLWAYYLPFLSFLFYLLRRSPASKYSTRNVILIVFATVFISELLRGFLYVTTYLIMLTMPLVYYAIKEKWDGLLFGKRMLQVSATALVSTACALLVLITQITLEKGNLSVALAHIQDTLLKRSIANPDQFSGLMAESLRASNLGVINTYLQGRALNFNGLFHTNLPWFEINYLSIFIFFAVCSLAFFLREAIVEQAFNKNKKALALIIATWVSALAPLSWLIMFKAHSYIHTQMNFILWQMPFTLFGFAMCGFVLSNLFRRKAQV